MSDKKLFLDSYVPDDYIKSTKGVHKLMGENKLDIYFEGGRSTEFYKGMLAGSKAYMAMVDGVIPETRDLFMDMLLDIHRAIVSKIDE